MATNTAHFNLAIYEGSDYFNPLVHENGNAEKIDAQMFKNMKDSAGSASELVSGTSHAITRVSADVPLFHFTATGAWKAGDTMTVNGVAVSVLTPDGKTLPGNAYAIGAEVFGYIRDTRVTILNATGGGDNAQTLEGHPASYFATAAQAAQLESDKAAKSKGVSAQLTVAGWSTSGEKYRQTVTVAGVTASNNIVVSPAPNSRDAYNGSYVQAVAQGANTVTFEADSLPTAAMYANIIVLG